MTYGISPVPTVAITSSPVMPGICTSRSTTSGRSSRIDRTAVWAVSSHTDQPIAVLRRDQTGQALPGMGLIVNYQHADFTHETEPGQGRG